MKSPKTKSEIRRARTPRHSSRYEKFAVETARVFSICIYTVSRPNESLPLFPSLFPRKTSFARRTRSKALKSGGWARTRSLFLSFSTFLPPRPFLFSSLGFLKKRESHNISSIFVRFPFPAGLYLIRANTREVRDKRIVLVLVIFTMEG